MLSRIGQRNVSPRADKSPKSPQGDSNEPSASRRRGVGKEYYEQRIKRSAQSHRLQTLSAHRGDVIQESVSESMAPQPHSPLYSGGEAHFQGDFASVERQRRAAEARRKEAQLQKKREAEFTRDEQRWDRMAEQERKEQQHIARLRNSPYKVKANKSSVSYNPLTLQYNDGQDGARMVHAENVARYKAEVRKQKLNTSGSYNPITGEDYPKPTLPEPPRP